MSATETQTAEVPTDHLSVQGDLEALASHPDDLGGPSFYDWSHRNYRTPNVVLSHEPPRPVTFWGHTNHRASTGHLAGQLGVQVVSNDPRPNVGVVECYWRKNITLTPGAHYLTGDLQLGPITMRPDSGSPVPRGLVFLRIVGWNAPGAATLPVYPHNSWQSKRLTTAARYLAGNYRVEIGMRVLSIMSGSQKPYGEVIIQRIQDVLRYGPAGHAPSAAVEEGEKERLAALEALNEGELERVDA